MNSSKRYYRNKIKTMETIFQETLEMVPLDKDVDRENFIHNFNVIMKVKSENEEI